jgi:hypothetical protein
MPILCGLIFVAVVFWTGWNADIEKSKSENPLPANIGNLVGSISSPYTKP